MVMGAIGASTFLGLEDTPPTYAGSGNCIVRVNAGATALEFTATPVSNTQWGALGALVEWTAWVPTLTVVADLSGYDVARYFRIGKLCFFYFQALNKNVTSGGYIAISLPFTSANTGDVALTCVVHDGTNWVGQVHSQVLVNNIYFQIYKDAAAVPWAGTETGVSITASGFFEIA